MLSFSILHHNLFLTLLLTPYDLFFTVIPLWDPFYLTLLSHPYIAPFLTFIFLICRYDKFLHSSLNFVTPFNVEPPLPTFLFRITSSNSFNSIQCKFSLPMITLFF
ncbi:hypothetical protein XENORESO_007371 [Xenotaenia resolanae]|uniref:Uncharacterized protein n=1 Tax=Xenotaenia resolanae TaxID=208358 RepID=A0ABV0WMP3_9TELE